MAAHYAVYILECSDGTFYVGCTNDIAKRLKAHNGQKAGARYTRTRRPVRLVYTEQFATKGEALSREALIKTWPRSKKVALIASSKHVQSI